MAVEACPRAGRNSRTAKIPTEQNELFFLKLKQSDAFYEWLRIEAQIDATVLPRFLAVAATDVLKETLKTAVVRRHARSFHRFTKYDSEVLKTVRVELRARGTILVKGNYRSLEWRKLKPGRAKRS
jgi:hypothetical protein